jgi:uncharacterized cupredoxin-like copper-binding protein
MSDLLTAVAQALNAPEAIVKRSAEARAKAGGVTVDEVLAAWSGGAVLATPASATRAAATPQVEESVAEEPAAVAEPAPEPTPAPPPAEVAPSPVAVMEVEEPAEVVPPLPLRQRIRVAGRIGAVTGSILGLVGAVAASPWLLPGASVLGEEGSLRPAVEVNSRMFLLATVLLSALFGLIVSSLARSIPGWLHPGMALAGSGRSGGLLGIGAGVVLGAVGAAVVTSAFGGPVEGVPGRVTLPLLTTLVLGLVGGAALGWLTAALVQAVGVPAVLATSPDRDMSQVRFRLGSAISVPLAGVVTLALLVLPFAYVLIRSNHLAAGGASVLAILTAASILAVAGLSASRPGMKITAGEFLMALTGIGVVVTIIIAVLLARGHGETAGEATGPGGNVTILARTNLSFDSTSWSVPEGQVTFEYRDEGDIVHTLTIEGRESDFLLQVETAGDVDQGSIELSPGSYVLYCTIRGHREAGMEGTLTVTEAPAEQSA